VEADSRQMSDAVRRIVGHCNLVLCVECGKCVAACPMVKIFGFSHAISPRGVVERALKGREMLNLAGIWYCLTCDLCTGLCPAGVRLRDFVEATRRTAMEEGYVEHGVFCRACGAYLWPRPRVVYLAQVLGEPSDGFLALCPRCRRQDLGRKVKASLPGSMRARIREKPRGDAV
jgi:ferredoxin